MARRHSVALFRPPSRVRWDFDVIGDDDDDFDDIEILGGGDDRDSTATKTSFGRRPFAF